MNRILYLCLGACFLTACTTAPKTSSMSDPGVDLSAYRTFNFVQYDQSPDAAYETLELVYLREATRRQMEQRGYTLSDEPELAINFSLDSQEKVRTRPVPQTGWGMGYDPFYDVYYDGWAMTHTTRIDQYTEGYLDIDVIDVAQRKLVWQGSTRGRLSDKDFENVDAALGQAVADVFTEFPVPIPGSQ